MRLDAAGAAEGVVTDNPVAVGGMVGRLPDLQPDRVSGEEFCAVCMENEPSRTLLPCRHTLFCADCAPRLVRCALCRAHIRSITDTETGEVLIDRHAERVRDQHARQR